MTYYYTYNDEQLSFHIDPENQFAAMVNKGAKWIDAECHATAWQILSPRAFKIYDKFERCASDRVWVYSRDLFGMSEEDFTAAVDELVRKGFLEQMKITDKETGEVNDVPSVYMFFERPRI